MVVKQGARHFSTDASWTVGTAETLTGRNTGRKLWQYYNSSDPITPQNPWSNHVHFVPPHAPKNTDQAAIRMLKYTQSPGSMDTFGITLENIITKCVCVCVNKN